MHIIRRFFLIISTLLLLLTSCDKDVTSKHKLSKEEIKAYNARIYEIRQKLLHEHTYDKDNLPIADSIYKESERVGSEYGKLAALQLKYYVYVADMNEGENFMKTINEFLDLAKKEERYTEYYDALNAKVYFYINDRKYFEAKDMVKKVLAEAEKSNDTDGLYFANYMMANIYKHRENYSTAIPYLKKALQYAGGDSIRTSLTSRGLTEAYHNCGNYKAALETAEMTRRYAPTKVHKIWAEHLYLVSLFETNQKKRFVEEWNKSIIRESDTQGVLPDYMLTQMNMYYAICQNNMDKAIEYAEEIEYETVRLNSLLKVYHVKKDFEKAFYVRTRLNEMRDSIQNAMQIEELAEMDTRLGNSQLKLEAEYLNNTIQRNIFIGIIIILIVVFAFIVVINIKNKKHMAILNQKNEELQKAREIAEKASRVKSIFISNISHELRTPLHQISGFAQVLADRDTPLDEEMTHQMADIIIDSTLHLTNVLDNILLVTDRLENLTEYEDVESVLDSTEYSITDIKKA